MKKLIIPQKYNNKKITNFIQDNFKSLKSSILFKALRQKDIKVNGKRISENVIIHTNDEIEIYITDEYLYGSIQKLKIVYEDENILAIHKPKDISVTEDEYKVQTLTMLVKNQFRFSTRAMP